MPDYAEWVLDGDEVGKVNVKNLLGKAGWKQVG